jgi:PAS domain S-box-containing protein
MAEIPEDPKTWIGVVSGIVAIWKLWKSVIWPNLTIFGKWGHTMLFGNRALSVQLVALDRKLEAIMMEVKPNGGSSIKDTVNGIAKEQQKTVFRLNAIEQRQWAFLADRLSGFMELNSNGECVTVNRTLLRMTGRSTEELMGHGWYNVIEQDQRDDVIEQWNDAIKYAREFEAEYFLQDVKGVTFPVSTKTYIVRKPDGEPSSFIQVITPLEQEKQRRIA